MSLPRSRSALITQLVVILGFCLPQAARAAAPSPADACAIIHTYESFCGNLEPQTCARYRQGFDCWGNAEHKKVWDDFFRLCGQGAERDSHECVAYLGIGGSCQPTVEPQPAPVMAYREPETLSVQDRQPTYELYRETPRLCLRSEGATAIENFISACGDVTADQCPQSGAVAEEFARWCGSKSACDCAETISCGSPQCPVAGTVPTTPGDTTAVPGGEGPGTPADGGPVSGTPPSTELPPAGVPNGELGENAPGAGLAPGFDEGRPAAPEGRPVEGGNVVAGALAVSGSGCALQADAALGELPSLAWALTLFPWLALRLRRARRRA